MRWLCVIALVLAAETVPVAQVVSVEGSVTITRAGEQVPAPLSVGMILQRGDRVAAAPGAEARLMVGGALRLLSTMKDRRWTAGEPFEHAAGPEPTSKPAGVDFANNEARRAALAQEIGGKGVLAILSANGNPLDQKSGGGSSVAEALRPDPVAAPPFAPGAASSEAPAALRPPELPETQLLEGSVPVDARAYRLPGTAQASSGLLIIRTPNRRHVYRAQVQGTRFEIPFGALKVGRSYTWKLGTLNGTFQVTPAVPRPPR